MTPHQHVQNLLAFIDRSPSAYHAVYSTEQRLQQKGFKLLSEKERWKLNAGDKAYVVRDDSSIIAFCIGKKPLTESGYKIIGAHTDSPGLKIKPNTISQTDGLVRLGVEIYGGPILATFTDRDLSLAGRISFKSDKGEIASHLVHFEQPLIRLPNLAIHMNRDVNESGLKLDKQSGLPLILSDSIEEQINPLAFQQLLESQSGIKAENILSWDMHVYDTQKGTFWGDKQQFYANSQLDNLASCHAGLEAFVNDEVLNSENTMVCAFFDHEEIGSESNKGANGSFLPDILQRIALALNLDSEDFQRSLANSFLISADMAHAYQPNFPSAYEPEHKVKVNQGPVIKLNANQRYSSESLSEAMFIKWCESANCPVQKYSHRNNIPCGSTIGPMTSAKLGIRSIDIGNPMWAMHSARESAGVFDHAYLINTFSCFFLE